MVAVEFLCVSLGLGGFHQRSTGLRHFALGFYAGCKVHNDQMRQFLVEPKKTKMVGSELWQIRASLRRFFRKWRCSEEKGSALPSLIFFYETHRSALSDQGVAALQQEIVSLTDWIRSKEQRFGCDDLKNVVPFKVNFVFFLLKHGGTRTQLCLENGILNCSLVAKRLPVDVADERNHRFGWIGEDPSFNRMNLSVLLVKKKDLPADAGALPAVQDEVPIVNSTALLGRQQHQIGAGSGPPLLRWPELERPRVLPARSRCLW